MVDLCHFIFAIFSTVRLMGARSVPVLPFRQLIASREPEHDPTLTRAAAIQRFSQKLLRTSGRQSVHEKCHETPCATARSAFR